MTYVVYIHDEDLIKRIEKKAREEGLEPDELLQNFIEDNSEEF